MIALDKGGIEQALPLIYVGLEKYCRIQAALSRVDVAHDQAFQTLFNGFYRVRRNAAWRSAFYALLQREKSERRPFPDVLRILHETTGRVEASFASKLAASIDPDRPVIDSIVLKHLGLCLPYYGATDARLVQIVEVHVRIGQEFSAYLGTDMGKYLVTRFEECYPNRQLTQVKMLDLTLWQSRAAA
jgi:hypothetical protein